MSGALSHSPVDIIRYLLVDLALGVLPVNGTSTNFVAGLRLNSAPFLENVQSITTDYTVTSNYNAMSVGPIGINTGVTVAIQTGGNWAIV